MAPPNAEDQATTFDGSQPWAGEDQPCGRGPPGFTRAGGERQSPQAQLHGSAHLRSKRLRPVVMWLPNSRNSLSSPPRGLKRKPPQLQGHAPSECGWGSQGPDPLPSPQHRGSTQGGPWRLASRDGVGVEWLPWQWLSKGWWARRMGEAPREGSDPHSFNKYSLSPLCQALC